nr:hypothetical protein [Tanacetum cinerariifolium]
MAPRRTTRSTANQETINATIVTNAQLQTMINQGVTAALAARDALRSTNGDDSHNSETCVRRTERAARECTYTDFLKYSKQKKIGEYIKNHSEPTKTTTTLEQEAEHRMSLHRIIWWKEAIWGSRPLCAKCNYHHDGPCAPKCHNCNKIGHSASDCRNVSNTNNANNQRGTGSGQKSRCHECGVQGNFRRECPKLKNNNNHRNQCGRNNAPARVYVVGRAGADPDANVVT